jgi:hypothetical protein
MEAQLTLPEVVEVEMAVIQEGLVLADLLDPMALVEELELPYQMVQLPLVISFLERRLMLVPMDLQEKAAAVAEAVVAKVVRFVMTVLETVAVAVAVAALLELAVLVAVVVAPHMEFLLGLME